MSSSRSTVANWAACWRYSVPSDGFIGFWYFIWATSSLRKAFLSRPRPPAALVAAVEPVALVWPVWAAWVMASITASSSQPQRAVGGRARNGRRVGGGLQGEGGAAAARAGPAAVLAPVAGGLVADVERGEVEALAGEERLDGVPLGGEGRPGFGCGGPEGDADVL